LGRKAVHKILAQEELKIVRHSESVRWWKGWLARSLIAAGFRLLQLLARTLRYEIDDRAGVTCNPVTENYIGALWHNRLLLIAYILQRFAPHRPGAGLISASRDGDLIAPLVERFGFQVVRGSTSRMGATAMLELVGVLAAGRDVLLTPDGPRGPAYEISPGVIFLAQKSGAAVLPLNMEYSSCWRIQSWDRFIIPRPFSKVRVIIDQPHPVRATSNPDEFEAERLRLQDAMMRLVEMR
jgi:lysophospholipid acyltransferase (LPLAT)-like uncharacterized protein